MKQLNMTVNSVSKTVQICSVQKYNMVSNIVYITGSLCDGLNMQNVILTSNVLLQVI